MQFISELIKTRRLPTVHIIALMICGAITGTTWLLYPADQTQREQKNIPLVLTTNNKDDAPTADQQEVTLNNKNTDTLQPSNTAVEVLSDNWVSYAVEKNDTLTALFKRAGLTATDVHYVTQPSQANTILSRLHPGDTLSFVIKAGNLNKVRYQVSPLKTLFIEREPLSNNYVAHIEERTPTTQQRYVTGTIENSLFVDAGDKGLSDSMIMAFAAIYGWDIDFTQDLRRGDQFRILFNEQYLDGEKINDGHIVAAQFINKSRTYTAIHYTDTHGNSSYFTPDGHSMRKAFLRMPVDFARISSSFNLSRRHPVLNKIRAHKGVDYAARTGTPVKASGDGKVIFRGRKGGYGNVVILKHGGNITTLYAHLSKFRSKVKQGSWVKQGQVIGYVGKTGLATGPHLHYEFRINGIHKDPMKVEFPEASPIPAAEKARFQTSTAVIMQQLNTYAAQQYAQME